MFDNCPRTNELLTIRLVCVAHGGKRYNPYVHFEDLDSEWFWERARTLEHGNAPTSMLVAGSCDSAAHPHDALASGQGAPCSRERSERACSLCRAESIELSPAPGDTA
jgi:hypothetical protein